MKTQLRAAFENLVTAKPLAPWVRLRLRHLLDRSQNGVYHTARYTKGGGWSLR